MILWYWSTKGGSGTSAVAAATALRLASNDRETTLVDLGGDQPAVLGLPHHHATAQGPGIHDWVAAGDAVAADAIGRLLVEITDRLRLLSSGRAQPQSDPQRLMLALEMLARSGPVVVDAGLDPHVMRGHLGRNGRPVCVMRPCYLAIDRARRVPGPYDRVMLVEEPGRALRASDVAATVSAAHIETVAWDPRVSRSVDAGTLIGLLPLPLRRFELPL